MEQLIKQIITEYNKEFNENPENFEVLVSRNIFEDKLRLSCENRKPILEAEKNWIQDLNGAISDPQMVNEIIYIILNNDYIEGCQNNEWIGTLCHELTHIIDHRAFADKVHLTNMSELESNIDYDMFFQWTEFNARRKGHYMLRKSMHGKSMRSNIVEMDILNRELPYQLNLFIENYQSTTDGIKQLYWTMQLLGRLKVWKDLFPLRFNGRTIHQILGNNEWLEELFFFIDRYECLDDIYPRFSEMRNIIKQNFIFS